jgi:hypothetical protein
LKDGLRQQRLVHSYYDKVLDEDAGLTSSLWPYSVGAVAVIAKADSKLYSLNYHQGWFRQSPSEASKGGQDAEAKLANKKDDGVVYLYCL